MAKAPNPQHRVQAPGRSGVSGWRDASRLARRHELSRTLIRIWVDKYEALELEFLKGAQRQGR